MIYDWEEIRRKYVKRGEKVSVVEFCDKEGINYHYLVKRAKEEEWDGPREAHLKSRSLTEKQQYFCHLYVKYYNATRAYRESFPNCSHVNANTQSGALMRKPEIKHYIKGLQEEMQETLLFDAQAIIRKYIDIAFADIFDVVELSDTGVPIIKDTADGTLIQQIKPTMYGTEVTLPDRIVALRELAKRFGLDISDFRKELEIKRLEVQERRMDLQELKEKGDDEALEKLDSILNAIDKEVSEQ